MTGSAMRRVMVCALTSLTLVATPAIADVKAGVEAWTRGDYPAAVREWRVASDAGDPDAQFNLGQAYNLGRGVEHDPRAAEDLFHKAALQKHPQAEDSYALALFQRDLPADALPWLERSAARGVPVSRYLLGTILFNGDGPDRDVPRAYSLIALAAQAGVAPAQSALLRLESTLSSSDLKAGRAFVERQARTEASSTIDRVIVTDASRSAFVAADIVAAPSTIIPAPAPSPPALGKTAPATAVSSAPPPSLAVTGSAAAQPVARDLQPSRPYRYQAQLGSFRVPAYAKAQAERLRPRISGDLSFFKSRGLVGLMGSFSSPADAEAACHLAKVPCVITSRRAGVPRG